MSESVDTLRRVLSDAEELLWVARSGLDVGAFIGRVRAKIDCLAPMSPKAASERRKRRAAQVRTSDRVAAQSPGITMVVGKWETDENGVVGRVLWNSADGLSPPSPSPPP
jgi:hypothetical protein